MMCVGIRIFISCIEWLHLVFSKFAHMLDTTQRGFGWPKAPKPRSLESGMKKSASLPNVSKKHSKHRLGVVTCFDRWWINRCQESWSHIWVGSNHTILWLFLKGFPEKKNAVFGLVSYFKTPVEGGLGFAFSWFDRDTTCEGSRVLFIYVDELKVSRSVMEAFAKLFKIIGKLMQNKSCHVCWVWDVMLMEKIQLTSWGW